MNFDEIFFHSKSSNKQETIEFLKISIMNEYIHDVSLHKTFKLSSQMPLVINFQDLTSWIYHKTYATSYSEAKMLWDLLFKCKNREENLKKEMKFEDFFQRYAEILYSKHEKAETLWHKNQIIVKLMKRTVACIKNLDVLINEIGFENLETNNKKMFCEEGMKFSFNIQVESLDNFDITNIFKDKDKDYLGHHIEIGYKDTIVFTQSVTCNGKIANFRMTQLSLSLDYMTGNIFVNVYEDFLKENKIEKNLIARRNLDLFSSLNKTFLMKTILKDVTDEILLKKLMIIYQQMTNEDGDEIPFMVNNLKNNKNLILDDKTPSVSHNCSLELFEEIKSEKFKLLKMNNTFNNPYIFLKLIISCENIKNIGDLDQYKEVLELRKEFLSKKSDKTIINISGYKILLGNLILPLRSVFLTENDIRIDKKFLKNPLLNNLETVQRKSCSIY